MRFVNKTSKEFCDRFLSERSWLKNAVFDSKTCIYAGSSGSFKVESTGYESDKLKDEFLTKLIDNIESRYFI